MKALSSARSASLVAGLRNRSYAGCVSCHASQLGSVWNCTSNTTPVDCRQQLMIPLYSGHFHAFFILTMVNPLAVSLRMSSCTPSVYRSPGYWKVYLIASFRVANPSSTLCPLTRMSSVIRVLT